MKSKTIFLPTQGGWGIQFSGPNAICGKEQDGGVSVCRIDSSGEETPGEILMRKEVRTLHMQLGKWISHWDKEAK